MNAQNQWIYLGLQSIPGVALRKTLTRVHEGPPSVSSITPQTPKVSSAQHPSKFPSGNPQIVHLRLQHSLPPHCSPGDGQEDVVPPLPPVAPPVPPVAPPVPPVAPPVPPVAPPLPPLAPVPPSPPARRPSSRHSTALRRGIPLRASCSADPMARFPRGTLRRGVFVDKGRQFIRVMNRAGAVGYNPKQAQRTAKRNPAHTSPHGN